MERYVLFIFEFFDNIVKQQNSTKNPLIPLLLLHNGHKTLLHFHMAACGIEASGLTIKNLDLGYVRPKLSTLQPFLDFRTRNPVRFDGLVLSQRSKNELTRWCSLTSDADSMTTANTEDCCAETKPSDAVSKLIPKSSESDIPGEVVKILRQDGDPVGFGDALIAVLPSFPGIKKLQ